MAKPTEVKTSSMVPETREIPKIEMPKESSEETMTTEKHDHKFVPLWMPITAFITILIAYLLCALFGYEVNTLRAIGVIGISGIFAAACWYLDEKSE